MRGEILDIFPPGYACPVRIDLFGDTVESMRLFDPRTQRSHTDLACVHITPVRELILSPEVQAGLSARVVENPQAFEGSRRQAFVENLHSGFLPAGSDYCLSLVYAHTASLPDYLSSDTLAIWCDPDESARQIAALEQDVLSGFQATCEERRAASEPMEMFLPFADPSDAQICTQTLCFESWTARRTLPQVLFATQANDDIRQELLAVDSSDGVLTALAARMQNWLEDGYRVLVACHTKSQCERLCGLFADYGLRADFIADTSCAALLERPLPGSVEIFTGAIARGFRTDAGRFVLLTEQEIFGEKKHRTRSARLRSGTALSDFSDLLPGDYIVHRDNGIGIYRGLETLNAGGVQADYLRLEYLGGDRLFLPVDRITLINKYECAEDSPPKLDKLGGMSWQSTKRKVKESIEKIAHDLIELYSARKVYRGHAFAPPDHYYREFEAAFPYEETPDQPAAMRMSCRICPERPWTGWSAVMSATAKPKLPCARHSGRPWRASRSPCSCPRRFLPSSTIRPFERLLPYPVTVDILSRFRSPKDQKQIIAGLAHGTVDIIIGTHRLVQRCGLQGPGPGGD